jgi:hypothetical protein
VARRPIYARLTDEAWRGWDRVATRRNITLTAVLEAMGEALDTGYQLPDSVIERARDIDRERRSRR